MNNFIVMSIKPEFCAKILDGSKKIELRKSAPNLDAGTRVIIYSTSPEKAVIGYCRIKRIIKLTPENMWENHSSDLGIDKIRFEEYYENYSTAVGLVLSEIVKLDIPIPLKSVREHFPIFQPPQTFKYLDKEEVINAYSLLAS